MREATLCVSGTLYPSALVHRAGEREPVTRYPRITRDRMLLPQCSVITRGGERGSISPSTPPITLHQEDNML